MDCDFVASREAEVGAVGLAADDGGIVGVGACA